MVASSALVNLKQKLIDHSIKILIPNEEPEQYPGKLFLTSVPNELQYLGNKP